MTLGSDKEKFIGASFVLEDQAGKPLPGFVQTEETLKTPPTYKITASQPLVPKGTYKITVEAYTLDEKGNPDFAKDSRTDVKIPPDGSFAAFEPHILDFNRVLLHAGMDLSRRNMVAYDLLNRTVAIATSSLIARR